MGIAVIVLVATCIYFRSRTKESYQTGRDSTSQISKIIYDNHLKCTAITTSSVLAFPFLDKYSPSCFA